MDSSVKEELPFEIGLQELLFGNIESKETLQREQRDLIERAKKPYKESKETLQREQKDLLETCNASQVLAYPKLHADVLLNENLNRLPESVHS